jgi:hypothetical protein
MSIKQGIHAAAALGIWIAFRINEIISSTGWIVSRAAGEYQAHRRGWDFDQRQPARFGTNENIPRAR